VDRQDTTTSIEERVHPCDCRSVRVRHRAIRGVDDYDVNAAQVHEPLLKLLGDLDRMPEALGNPGESRRSGSERMPWIGPSSAA
jgi:hypothetical protein